MSDRANQQKSTRILIVLMGSLGDVVRGLSVAHAIKSANPSSHITWLVEPKCRGIVELCEGIDEVLIFDRARPVTGLLDLFKELGARRFDICLDMQRHFKSGVFSWFSGAARRIGFNRKDSKEFNWLFQSEQIPPANEVINKFLLYKRFAQSLGIEPPSDARISLRSDDALVDSTWGKYGFVVMGSSWRSKDWVGEGYQQLLDSLDGMTLVLVGDKGHSGAADQLSMRVRTGSGKIVNLCGKTSLAQLVGVIKKSAFGVGPDSGPGHIASACGVPYVSLFGPTSPKLVSPVGSESLVVTSSIGCSPCYRRNCPGLNRLCMRLISVPAVVRKVRLATASRLD